MVRSTRRLGRLERLRACPSAVNISLMSLTEIEKAVDELSPTELTKLAAYIANQMSEAPDD